MVAYKQATIFYPLMLAQNTFLCYDRQSSSKSVDRLIYSDASRGTVFKQENQCVLSRNASKLPAVSRLFRRPPGKSLLKLSLRCKQHLSPYASAPYILYTGLLESLNLHYILNYFFSPIASSFASIFALSSSKNTSMSFKVCVSSLRLSINSPSIQNIGVQASSTPSPSVTKS